MELKQQEVMEKNFPDARKDTPIITKKKNHTKQELKEIFEAMQLVKMVFKEEKTESE